MNTPIRILSTKKLTPSQKELILNTGVELVEYNAIHINFVKEDESLSVTHAIFTSKNAYKAIQNTQVTLLNCYCVGVRTQALLETHGHTVVEMGHDASALAEKIIKNHSDKQFTFFCGNLRRDELPLLLQQHYIKVQEKVVYHTRFVNKKFKRIFDGVLFFSPSAVQSYTKVNTIGDSMPFCIGETTAMEVKKHVPNHIVANRPTIENVIVQVAKYVKKNKKP